jgi:hypothetical protein
VTRISSHASFTAPVDPGSAKSSVPFATPAVARDWIVEVPIYWKLIQRKRSPNPGISVS